MKTLDRLRRAFSEGLVVDISEIENDLKYEECGWDSIAHISVVMAIEEEFNVSISIPESLGMNSLKEARFLLEDKGIEF